MSGNFLPVAALITGIVSFRRSFSALLLGQLPAKYLFFFCTWCHALIYCCYISKEVIALTLTILILSLVAMEASVMPLIANLHVL